MAGPNQGEVYDGYRYMGGDPKSEASWEQAAPVDVSSEWGAGARRLPNGTIERVGPRGGVTQIGQAGGDAATDVGKLTEAQGKAVNFGMMMRGGERDYQAARAAGYNPATLRNQVADFADLIPFDGGALPRLIRDDVSDQGRQAETRWTEANLRQLSGAAVTPGEVTRTAAINFDRANDELAEQRYRTRAESYAGTRFTAGPGAAALGDYPAAGNVGPTENGLPTYPGIAVLAANISDGGPGTSQPGQTGPGGSPDNPFQIVGASREDTIAALRRGGWFKNAEGEPYQLPGAEPEFGTQEGDQMVGSGVAVRPREDWTPEGAVEQRREMWNPLRQVDAFVRGAADAGSLEFADEIAAGADALIGRGNGRSLGERYRSNVGVQRAIDKADGEDAGFARNMGEVAGYGATAMIAAPRLLASAGLKIANPVLRAGVTGIRNALVGAGVAGTAAAGQREGNALQRGQAFAEAAPMGAVAGAIIPAGISGGGALDRAIGAPVARGAAALGRTVGRVIGSGGERMGVNGATALRERNTPNALQSAVEQFGNRLNPRRVGALQENANQQRLMGFEPTLADLVDDAGQGQLRSLSSIDTAARPRAVAFGRARRAGAQGDVSNIARRFVSDDPRTASRVSSDLANEQRAASGPAYDAARASPPITVSADVGEALFSGNGPQQIRGAASAYKSSVNPEERVLALELQAMADAAEAGMPAGNIEMSVGAADLLSRYLAKAGGTDANLGRIFGGLGREIRNQARQQSPEYEAALSGYAERAQLDDAVDFGRRFLVRRGNQDFANEAAGMLPAQRDVARVAARDAIEDAGSTTGGAASLLDDLSIGQGTGLKSDALINDPEAMRAMADAARMRLQTGRNVDPRAGSNTNLNRMDTENVDGAVEFLKDGARIIASPLRGTIDVVARRFQNRGFSPQEAEALVDAAIDSTRTDELIAMLSQRMTRKQARTLARAVQRQVASGSGSSSAE